jgi:hypothetical protein
MKNTPDDAKQKLNIGMEKEMARQIAYSILEYITAWRTAKLVAKPPASRQEVGREDVATAIQDLNDELFGDDEPVPAVNGHKVQLLSPEVAISASKFLNGVLCPMEHQDLYHQYWRSTQWLAVNLETLIGWRYRN